MIWLARLGVALLGAYVCAIATFLHRVGLDVGPVFVPWGLAVGVLTGFLVARALTAWYQLAESFTIGWAFGLIFAFGLGTQNRLLLLDAHGAAFLVLGLGALLAALSARLRL